MRVYEVLTPTEAREMVDRLRDESLWTPGLASNVYASEHVKNNYETVYDDPTVDELAMKLASRMDQIRHDAFAAQMMTPRFNRCEVGEFYGKHADAGWMGGKLRTDMACTVFLNDDYEGGELSVDGKKIRGEAGTAVLYECWREHEVMPVTRGTRYCAITWIQSRFRDVTHRELLTVLQDTLLEIDRTQPEGRLYSPISTVYGKLVRMWTE